jgi:hypothetical protein
VTQTLLNFDMAKESFDKTAPMWVGNQSVWVKTKKDDRIILRSFSVMTGEATDLSDAYQKLE